MCKLGGIKKNEKEVGGGKQLFLAELWVRMKGERPTVIKRSTELCGSHQACTSAGDWQLLLLLSIIHYTKPESYRKHLLSLTYHITASVNG